MRMTRGAFQPISLSKCTKVLSLLLISLAQMNCEGKLMLEIGEDFFGKLTVIHSGSNVNGIDDVEAARFGLLPENACAQKLGKRMGRDPDYCHWRGDVHRRFQWPEVKSVYRIQDVKLVENTTTLDLIHRESVDNDRGLESKVEMSGASDLEIFDLIKHENVENSICQLGGSVSVDYDPYFEKAVPYEHACGQTEFRFRKKSVQFGQFAKVVLRPSNVNRTVELKMVRKTAVFSVTYQKSITGCVVADYYYPYQNHHFHCIDVRNNILPVSSLVQTYTERLRVDHYQTEYLNIIYL